MISLGKKKHPVSVASTCTAFPTLYNTSRLFQKFSYNFQSNWKHMATVREESKCNTLLFLLLEIQHSAV